jgi:hypothetical protein
MTPLVLEQALTLFDHHKRLDEAEFFVERVRAPAPEILRFLRRKPGRHVVFCGSIGAGKSSELAYLGRLLNQSTAPRYFVVGLDAAQSVAQIGTLRPAEMLMLIGAALVRTYQEWWLKKVPDSLLDKLREAFAGAMEGAPRRVEPTRVIEGVTLLTWAIASHDAGSAGKAAGGLLGGMGKLLEGKGKRTPIGGLTRESARESDSDVVALLEAVNDILQFVREEDGREPVVLVDGLDKIDVVEELGTIRQLLCTHVLGGVGASCIYTAPVTMALTSEWSTAGQYFECKRLTNMLVSESRIHAVEPSLIADGRARMREVVSKRLAAQSLREADVFEAGTLDLLITTSGGLLRSLIQLVGKSMEMALDRESSCVAICDAEDAIGEISQNHALGMNAHARKELEHIAQHGEPSTSESAMQLLLSSSVVYYRNGSPWWEPAPLVARLLK